MIKHIKKAILFILRISSTFVKIDNKQLTVLFSGYSGSNIIPVIRYLQNYKETDYRINIIRIDKVASEPLTNVRKLIHLLKTIKVIMKSKIVLSTHGFYRISKKSIYINL